MRARHYKTVFPAGYTYSTARTDAIAQENGVEGLVRIFRGGNFLTNKRLETPRLTVQALFQPDFLKLYIGGDFLTEGIDFLVEYTADDEFISFDGNLYFFLAKFAKSAKKENTILDMRAFSISLYLKQPPFCPSGILPPKEAGRDCGATTSLAHYEGVNEVLACGKGLRVRGLK
jgi:hypothetical protein